MGIVCGIFGNCILRDKKENNSVGGRMRCLRQIVILATGVTMDKPLPGCFACGDIAGKPYQYIKAAGQGNVAALSAVEYLSRR